MLSRKLAIWLIKFFLRSKLSLCLLMSASCWVFRSCPEKVGDTTDWNVATLPSPTSLPVNSVFKAPKQHAGFLAGESNVSNRKLYHFCQQRLTSAKSDMEWTSFSFHVSTLKQGIESCRSTQTTQLVMCTCYEDISWTLASTWTHCQKSRPFCTVTGLK